MVFEFSILGFQLFSVSLFRVETVTEETEHIHNTAGEFERRDMPFGFSALPYSEGFDDEEED